MPRWFILSVTISGMEHYDTSQCPTSSVAHPTSNHDARYPTTTCLYGYSQVTRRFVFSIKCYYFYDDYHYLIVIKVIIIISFDCRSLTAEWSVGFHDQRLFVSQGSCSDARGSHGGCFCTGLQHWHKNTARALWLYRTGHDGSVYIAMVAVSVPLYSTDTRTSYRYKPETLHWLYRTGHV